MHSLPDSMVTLSNLYAELLEKEIEPSMDNQAFEYLDSLMTC